MDNELKPCPFCGSPAKMESDEEEWGFAVSCSNTDCPVDATTYARSTAEEATEAWNTRAERTCKDKAEAALIDGFLCSECGCCLTAEQFYCGELNYCPNCGAKVVEQMEKEKALKVIYSLALNGYEVTLTKNNERFGVCFSTNEPISIDILGVLCQHEFGMTCKECGAKVGEVDE